MKFFLKNSIGRLDFIAWLLVLMFFCGSALIFNGNLLLSSAGAVGVIAELFFIALAIEIIIECLKNTKGIGTLTGFITNGPEAVCLIVGLVVGDIIFAASTPLGSNFMNPVLLLAAAIISGQFLRTLATKAKYSSVTVLLTALAAGSFFILNISHYLFWLMASVTVTTILFFLRPEESNTSEPEEYSFKPSHWLLPAIAVLMIAGYYLDPVVSFAATHSLAPKGVIGFVVLSTLTSWPEFKSCLALLKRKKSLAAILNITVSNITNIWLAAVGVATYLLSHSL